MNTMDDSKYIQYDTIIAQLFSQIGARTGKDSVISFKNFDPRNEEHLCIFHVAVLVHTINYKNVYINVGILDEIKFEIKHWNMRHQYKWNHSYKNLDINEVLDAIKSIPEYKELPFGLASIYEAYYMNTTESEKND